MAPNYTLGVWKAPAAPASILYPPTTPPQPGCMCWPTSTLTLLPGVANSSQPDGTISGRCQESKMMNYEYPGDVDRIPALGGKKRFLFFFCAIFGQPNKQTDSEGVCSGLEWLISMPRYKWGPTEIGCFSEVVKDFMCWRACLAV